MAHEIHARWGSLSFFMMEKRSDLLISLKPYCVSLTVTLLGYKQTATHTIREHVGNDIWKIKIYYLHGHSQVSTGYG